MPTARQRTIAVLLLSVALGCSADDDPPAARNSTTTHGARPAEELNREWLADDIAVCDGLRKILPGNPTRFADFYTALRQMRPASDPNPPAGRDLGFGGTLQVLTFHGGHASIVVRTLVFDGRIAMMRSEYLGMTPVEWSTLKSELLPRWPATARDAEDGATWTFFDQASFDAFETKVHAALGARSETKVPPALAADFALLTDPLNELRFGTSCGDGGDKPEARVAIERLTGTHGADLLGNVLRGDNPVGRIYAAEALLATRGIADLSERDKATIAAIRKLVIPIAVCNGCEVQDEKAAALLDVQRKK